MKVSQEYEQPGKNIKAIFQNHPREILPSGVSELEKPHPRGEGADAFPRCRLVVELVWLNNGV